MQPALRCSRPAQPPARESRPEPRRVVGAVRDPASLHRFINSFRRLVSRKKRAATAARRPSSSLVGINGTDPRPEPGETSVEKPALGVHGSALARLSGQGPFRSVTGRLAAISPAGSLGGGRGQSPPTSDIPTPAPNRAGTGRASPCPDGPHRPRSGPADT